MSDSSNHQSGDFTLKLEAVIVCRDYSDFLEHTLPLNLQHFDRAVVVTHPSDAATKALCNRLGVDCIETDVFHEDGDKFNKGRAINLGLAHLRHDDWLLHIDADIILPHRFRAMLQKGKLDPECVYGADRLNVKSWEAFEKHREKITGPQFLYRCLAIPRGEFELGARLIHNELGYCPIGYFQLWNKATKKLYPIYQGSAEHCDVLFAAQWPRPKRVLLPEFWVFHLESEQAQMGVNWNGRKTKPFGPEKKK